MKTSLWDFFLSNQRNIRRENNEPSYYKRVSLHWEREKKKEKERKLTQTGHKSVLFWLQECDQLVVSPGRGQSCCVPACLCPSPSVGAAQPLSWDATDVTLGLGGRREQYWFPPPWISHPALLRCPSAAHEHQRLVVPVGWPREERSLHPASRTQGSPRCLWLCCTAPRSRRLSGILARPRAFW